MTYGTPAVGRNKPFTRPEAVYNPEFNCLSPVISAPIARATKLIMLVNVRKA
jgi:hypothetical protein